jgi:hypothetical protein
MRVSSLSLRSSNSFLRLLPRLPVTSIPPFIFSSITRCTRQFLRKMWPIQFAFRLRISCRIFLCFLTLSNTSFLTWSVQLIFSILLQHHILSCTGKKKVKCTLVQALRLCTGRTAHRGRRDITLPFLDHGTRRGKGSASRPGRSLPPGNTRYPLYRRLGGPQARSGQAR